MRRRDFILAAAAVGAWPPVAAAQPPRLTLGYLSGRALARTLERQIPAINNSLGCELPVLYASQPAHFETAIGDMRRHNAEALVISSDAFFDSHSEWLAELTVRNKIPAIHQVPEFVTAGGLMSFGGSLMEAYRQVGVYAGRILKGEAPGELPVQQSARVHFAINIRTAKTFGMNMPASLTALADEVIE